MTITSPSDITVTWSYRQFSKWRADDRSHCKIFHLLPWSWILTFEQGFFYTDPDSFSLSKKRVNLLLAKCSFRNMYVPTKLVLLMYNTSLYKQLLYIIVAKGQVLVIGLSAKRPYRASFSEVKYKSAQRVPIHLYNKHVQWWKSSRS